MDSVFIQALPPFGPSWNNTFLTHAMGTLLIKFISVFFVNQGRQHGKQAVELEMLDSG
jgi:hypothetical protein